MFLPSGRLHAIGAGNVLAEVQQNSDTTYRVFDWNRRGLDGLPRALHVGESLESIDFADFEPALAARSGGPVAECEFFRVERWALEAPRAACEPGAFAVFACVAGAVRVRRVAVQAGGFVSRAGRDGGCRVAAGRAGHGTVAHDDPGAAIASYERAPPRRWLAGQPSITRARSIFHASPSFTRL